MFTYRTLAGVLLAAILPASTLLAQDPAADDPLNSEVVAPPGTRRLESTLGGAYFVDEKLLDEYEALKSRLSRVREEIAAGDATSDAALRSLAEIEAESTRLRGQIEEKRVLVSAFGVFSQTSTEEFPLGDEGLVIITGDHVRVRGWEGPGIKCVVEKILVAREKPVDAAFGAIRVEHVLGTAPEKVGLTRAERDAGEAKFLVSEDGQKLTPEQRAGRQKFVDEIHRSYNDYLAFQGREVNQLQLKGLGFDEGNKNLTLKIMSPGGGGTVSSQWQRHATLTVYLPKCKALAVRGCLVGLDIENIDCDLVLTTHDSRDRNYQGQFEVVGVTGNVTSDQVPVRRLAKVGGDVVFRLTDDLVNSGTMHSGGTRTFSPYAMQPARIEEVAGDLIASFLRTEVDLQNISGRVDVTNRFGVTRWAISEAAGALATERNHRIVSDGGQIFLTGPASVLTKTPLFAYTQCGRLHTNLSREVLDDANFSTGHPRQNWHGFVTPSAERFDFSRFERPAAILAGGERSPGIDLVSYAGLVSVLTSEQADEESTGQGKRD
jgi:hypothetical protein